MFGIRGYKSMKKEKLNEMVRLEDLAKAYSKILNDYYDLSVDFNLNIDRNKSAGFMRATRQPYKISNIKSESINVVLRFYLCCENKERYLDEIALITQLCGLNKMDFKSNENEYKAYSFLDFAEPLNDPQISMGKWYTTVELRGTVLCTQKVGGVLIGNEIETEITFHQGEENEVSGKIEVLSDNTTLAKTQESPQLINNVTAQGYNNTQAYSYSYTILILKNKICEEIVKIIENVSPLQLNEKVVIKNTFPAFTGESFSTERNLIMTGCNIDKNAGAFVTATLSFQDRFNIENLQSLIVADSDDNYLKNISKVVVNVGCLSNADKVTIVQDQFILTDVATFYIYISEIAERYAITGVSNNAHDILTVTKFQHSEYADCYKVVLNTVPEVARLVNVDLQVSLDTLETGENIIFTVIPRGNEGFDFITFNKDALYFTSTGQTITFTGTLVANYALADCSYDGPISYDYEQNGDEITFSVTLNEELDEEYYKGEIYFNISVESI